MIRSDASLQCGICTCPRVSEMSTPEESFNMLLALCPPNKTTYLVRRSMVVVAWANRQSADAKHKHGHNDKPDEQSTTNRHLHKIERLYALPPAVAALVFRASGALDEGHDRRQLRGAAPESCHHRPESSIQLSITHAVFQETPLGPIIEFNCPHVSLSIPTRPGDDIRGLSSGQTCTLQCHNNKTRTVSTSAAHLCADS